MFIWVLMHLLACSKSGDTNSPTNISSTIPLAPNNLLTDSISSSLESNRYVKLNWVDNSTNEDGFKIERKGLNDNFIQIATVNSNVTQFIDSINLAPNTTYIYRLYSYNSKGSSLNYTNYDTVKTRIEISFGITYGGGIVAYIFKPGDLGYVKGMIHGFISATTDQSVPQQNSKKIICNSVWTYKTNLVGNTLTTIGSGGLNTQNIINSGAIVVAYYYPYYDGVIRVCTNYTSGGFKDWVLPSKDELNILFINRDKIGGFTKETDSRVGNYAWYWSSSEFDVNNAWMLDFSDGTITSRSKQFAGGARAIRYF